MVDLFKDTGTGRGSHKRSRMDKEPCPGQVSKDTVNILAGKAKKKTEEQDVNLFRKAGPGAILHTT